MLCVASNSKVGNWEYKLFCIGAQAELYGKMKCDLGFSKSYHIHEAVGL